MGWAEGMRSGLFQHSPEAGSIATGGGHHVAGAKEIEVAVSHFKLKLRQISKVRRIITRKGVAAHIRYPAGKPSRTTECLPAVLPITWHPAILPSHARQRTQRNHTPAAWRSNCQRFQDEKGRPFFLTPAHAQPHRVQDATIQPHLLRAPGYPPVRTLPPQRRAGHLNPTPPPASYIQTYR